MVEGLGGIRVRALAREDDRVFNLLEDSALEVVELRSGRDALAKQVGTVERDGIPVPPALVLVGRPVLAEAEAARVHLVPVRLRLHQGRSAAGARPLGALRD